MKQETPALLIIGASCRAAAWSARHAGFRVAALDLFADRDLRGIADAQLIRSFPDSVIEQAQDYSDHTIVLAGGMENYPNVVAELEKQNVVVGASSRQIIAIRSLANLKRWVQKESNPQIRFPKTISDQPLLQRLLVGEQDRQGMAHSPVSMHHSTLNSREFRWLWKTTNSAGGLGVDYWNGESQLNFGDGYLEQEIEGDSIGVVVRCSKEGAQYIGATLNRSYVNFIYGGSEGPIELTSEQIDSIESFMSLIGEELDFRGLLQADFIKTPTNDLYLLEINPRWSASMEILELATGRLLMAEHLGRATSNSLVGENKELLSNDRYIKRIFYATRSGTVSSRLSEWMMTHAYDAESRTVAGWADIPMPGTQFAPQNPIATVLVAFEASDTARGNFEAARLVSEADQMLAAE
jgi:uncharacterized protein